MLDHLLGGAVLFDPSLVHHHHPVGELQRFLLIVGHEDAGEMDLRVQPPQPPAQLLGPLAVAFPEHPHTEARTAAGYSSPHELGVSRTDEGGGLWAIVTDVRISGAIVKIEVTDDQRQPMQIELGREQYEQIRAIIGEKVYVKPRKVRVFMEGAVGLIGASGPNR